MWDRPEELIGRSDVDKHIQEPPHKRGLEDSKRTGVDILHLTEHSKQRQFSALGFKLVTNIAYVSTAITTAIT